MKYRKWLAVLTKQERTYDQKTFNKYHEASAKNRILLYKRFTKYWILGVNFDVPRSSEDVTTRAFLIFSVTRVFILAT
uniref:Uncharacterized protein n=1 Tax=Trichobilharzia regenti TaxID=157069 RepID=A0AA85K7C5_TRIRE|nr:unnamed protein product [Trichobilharzia regenti]